MKPESWNRFATCPICKTRFKIGRLNRHIRTHPDITPESELLIRNAAIASLRKSYAEEKIESDRRSIHQKNVNATDVLMGGKHLHHSPGALSGGAFGQGKKR